MSNLKQLCDVCGFVVKPEGHAERCRVRSEPREGWSEVRLRAWFGDDVHRVDVKLALVLRGCAHKQLDSQMQSYTHAKFTAAYMRELGLAEEGRSDHSIADAFESRYEGDFRIQYLFSQFPDQAQSVLQAWAPPALVQQTAGVVGAEE